MPSNELADRWSMIMLTWRSKYRPWFSLATMIIATTLIASRVYHPAAWSAQTSWSLAALLGLLAWYSPALGLFLGVILFAFHLLATSVWLAIIQVVIAVALLIAARSKENHLGFWLLIFLIAPWSTAHGLVYLPLFGAVFLYRKRTLVLSTILGVQTAFWASVQGSLPDFNHPIAIIASQPASFGAWIKLQLAQVSITSLLDLQPWLMSNLRPGLTLIISMLLIASIAERIFAASSGSQHLRKLFALVVCTALGAAGLYYLSEPTSDWLGVMPQFWIAAPSGVLAWIITMLLEAPSRSRLEEIKNMTERVSWEAIGGYEDVKKEIREAIEPYTSLLTRRRMQREKLPLVKGILLYGPPGVGKTLFARIIASETRMKFISVAGAEFFNKWVGESEERLRKVFKEARENAPCVIFFDEIESFLQPREQTGANSIGDLLQRVVATFIAEMDGYKRLENVLVIGATNYPDQIDSAAIRPGRFDKIIFIPPPDAEARKAIWHRLLKGRGSAGLVDVDTLVAVTERYTGADIESIVHECYRMTTGEPVTSQTFLAVLKHTKPTVSLSMMERYAELARKYGRRIYTSEFEPVSERTRLSWEDIAGMDAVKNQLRELVELPIKDPDLFTQYRLRPTKGVLLYGPPGCGKTLFSRVLADVLDATFLSVSGPELLNSSLGESERRIRELFREARENAPAIVFFDEIDALAARREEITSSLQVVNQLLTEMDGMKELKGVVVLAATNRPAALDPALLRPGRFDRVVYVGLPDVASRRAQLEYHLRGRPIAVDLDVIAAETEGYTGAEIEYIVNEATFMVVRQVAGHGIRPITTSDIRAVIARTPRSVSEADLSHFAQLIGLQRN